MLHTVTRVLALVSAVPLQTGCSSPLGGQLHRCVNQMGEKLCQTDHILMVVQNGISPMCSSMQEFCVLYLSIIIHNSPFLIEVGSLQAFCYPVAVIS